MTVQYVVNYKYISSVTKAGLHQWDTGWDEKGMFAPDANMENGTAMGIVNTCNPKQMAEILEMTISSAFSPWNFL